MDDVRKILLKPLAKRKTSPTSKDLLSLAWKELNKNALAMEMMPAAVQAFSKAKKGNGRWDWNSPDFPRSFVDLATVLVHARMISHQEYTFYVCMAASRVHEDRLQKSLYPEIEDITDQMRHVEEAHGLESDHYWSIDEAPEEYNKLRIEYESADDKRFAEALDELGADDLARLYVDNRKEYNRQRERGRRLIFHGNETVASISDSIIRYESEARRSAEVKSYTAAIILLGAAVEGLLLIRCLRSKKKAETVAASLPAKVRPSHLDDPLRWTLDNLIEVCLKAGWLPVVTMGSLEIRPDLLAHLLRRMRNNVHPGRVAREHPWIEIERGDYEQAEVIYTTVFATTFQGHHLRRLKKAALLFSL